MISPVINFTKGISYFFSGFRLILRKGLKRYVFIPLVINVAFFASAFAYLLSQLSDFSLWLLSFLPNWLIWLEWIFYPMALLLSLVSFGLLFNVIGSFIAAPFNGLLAEKLTEELKGIRASDMDWQELLEMIPRTFAREWQKLLYTLPRFIVFFILSWLIPVVGPIIWFVFVAWLLAMQYCDYAYDNHKIDFADMLDELQDNRSLCLGFGACVSLCSSIPIIHLLVIPVSVCGATHLWVKELDHDRELDDSPKHQSTRTQKDKVLANPYKRIE